MAALKEHIKRAAYQAGAVCGQATVTQPVLPSPAELGWKLQGQRWLVNGQHFHQLLQVARNWQNAHANTAVLMAGANVFV